MKQDQPVLTRVGVFENKVSLTIDTNDKQICEVLFPQEEAFFIAKMMLKAAKFLKVQNEGKPE